MRWLSCFALSLYLFLLCTPQAFAVHDARLSPLADTQFHAVTPAFTDASFSSEQDSSDEPPLLLPETKAAVGAISTCNHYYPHNTNGSSVWPGSIQARAPPHSQSQSISPVV